MENSILIAKILDKLNSLEKVVEDIQDSHGRMLTQLIKTTSAISSRMDKIEKKFVSAENRMDSLEDKAAFAKDSITVLARGL